MIKKMGLFSVFIFSIVIVYGCSQSPTASDSGTTGSTTAQQPNYTKAETDLKKVANGIQSQTSAQKAKKATSIKSLLLNNRINPQHTPTESYWVSEPYTYSWTTSSGKVITGVGTYSSYYLDANNNPTQDYSKAKKHINHSDYSASGYYSSTADTQITLPSDKTSFPMISNATSQANITFVGTSPSTFEMKDFSFTVTTLKEGQVYKTNLNGTMSWGFSIPGSTYTYYYGTINVAVEDITNNSFTGSGEVYQDLENNSKDDGAKVGAITLLSNSVKITLLNGKEITPGEF